MFLTRLFLRLISFLVFGRSDLPTPGNICFNSHFPFIIGWSLFFVFPAPIRSAAIIVLGQSKFLFIIPSLDVDAF